MQGDKNTLQRKIAEKNHIQTQLMLSQHWQRAHDYLTQYVQYVQYLHNGSKFFLVSSHQCHGLLTTPPEHTFHPSYPHAIHNVASKTERNPLWSGQGLTLLKGNPCNNCIEGK